MTTDHKPLTAAEIEELRELEAKATPGYWEACGVDGNGQPLVFQGSLEVLTCWHHSVESIEREAHANAALIAAMRNALPRLLSMLQPPADAEVREAVEYLNDFRHSLLTTVGPEFTARIDIVLSNVRATQAQRLTPPTDAEVRKAVELLEVLASRESEWTAIKPSDARTLLSFVRAAQPPRLTGHTDDLAVDDFSIAMKAKLAQKRAEGRSGWDDPDECHIDFLVSLLHGHIRKGDPVDIANIAMMLWSRGLRGNGSVPAPRLAGERLEAVKQVIERLGTLDGAMWPKEKRSLWYKLRAAFPELGEG